MTRSVVISLSKVGKAITKTQYCKYIAPILLIHLQYFHVQVGRIKNVDHWSYPPTNGTTPINLNTSRAYAIYGVESAKWTVCLDTTLSMGTHKWMCWPDTSQARPTQIHNPLPPRQQPEHSHIHLHLGATIYQPTPGHAHLLRCMTMYSQRSLVFSTHYVRLLAERSVGQVPCSKC